MFKDWTYRLIFFWILLYLVIAYFSEANAQIQNIAYNPDGITTVKTKAGVVTTIQLGKDEFLTESMTGVGLGDPLAWDVSVAGNNVLLRPIAENPDTNAVLVSNKRTYLLKLETAHGKSQPSFLVRFSYPQAKKIVPQKNTLPCTDGIINRHYYQWGDGELAPTEAWDDGRFACFRFPTTLDLPVVYRKLPDGTEALVNAHMQQDVMVVRELSNEYRFRLGNTVLGIMTEYATPANFNHSGTTTGQYRTVIKNEQ